MTASTANVSEGVAEMATEQLEVETCTLAAQLAAATCRFLTLVGELERREAWRSWGCRSLAHWLSWQCGLGLVAARQHVRVAVALRELPQMRDAFARGELSYSKVRALTRIEGMDERAERELVGLAKIATAAQVDRTVAAYRGVVRNVRGTPVEGEVPSAHVLTRDDGSGVLVVPLRADELAEVLAAVETARRRLRERDDPAGSSLRAAVLEVARVYRQPDPHAQPAAELVVHTDVELTVGADATRGVIIDRDAVRRLACDAAVRRVSDRRGDLGRRRRTLSRKQRRALVRRDGDQCRFPGCSSRHYLHAHHIRHWIDGGATDLDNLVLLCPFHHRLVHDGGWHIRGDANDELTFVAGNGRRLHESVRRRLRAAHWRTVPLRHRRVHAGAIRTAYGERMDLDLTITALCCLVPPDRN